MDFKEHKKAEQIINSLKRELNTFMGYKIIQELPDEMIGKANSLSSYLNRFDIDSIKPEPIVPTGDFFDTKKLKKSVKKATGYIWEMTEMNNEEIEDCGLDPENIEFSEGIRPLEVKVYEFNRESKGRELWLIIIVLMPGCAFAEWNTDSVSGRTEICYNLDDLVKEVSDIE